VVSWSRTEIFSFFVWIVRMSDRPYMSVANKTVPCGLLIQFISTLYSQSASFNVSGARVVQILMHHLPPECKANLVSLRVLDPAVDSGPLFRRFAIPNIRYPILNPHTKLKPWVNPNTNPNGGSSEYRIFGIADRYPCCYTHFHKNAQNMLLWLWE